MFLCPEYYEGWIEPLETVWINSWDVTRGSLKQAFGEARWRARVLRRTGVNAIVMIHPSRLAFCVLDGDEVMSLTRGETISPGQRVYLLKDSGRLVGIYPSRRKALSAMSRPGTPEYGVIRGGWWGYIPIGHL